MARSACQLEFEAPVSGPMHEATHAAYCRGHLFSGRVELVRASSVEIMASETLAFSTGLEARRSRRACLRKIAPASAARIKLEKVSKSCVFMSSHTVFLRRLSVDRVIVGDDGHIREWRGCVVIKTHTAAWRFATTARLEDTTVEAVVELVYVPLLGRAPLAALGLTLLCHLDTGFVVLQRE